MVKMADLTSSPKSTTENDQNSNPVEAQNNLNLSRLIGNTPLIRLNKLPRPHDYSCQIFAKCEFKNPSGSSWDRYVSAKIREINQSDESYNATHFATGGNCDLCFSLAWAGAAGDYRVTVLPGPGCPQMDSSKITVLKSYGANVALSLRDAPLHKQTQSNLNALIQQLEDASGILHHRITGTASDASKFYYETIPTEIFRQMHEFGNENPDFDIIVCSGENKGLAHGVAKRFFESSGKSPSIYGVDLTGNSFWDKMVDDTESDATTETSKLIKWMQVSDAEAYDTARRLMREEGLTVGPVSGAVVALALRLIEDQELGINPNAKILVVLTDSLTNSGQEFLTTEWMVQKGYYDVEHLESLFWWHDMAIENICPPDFTVVPPNATVQCVLSAMVDTKTERVVVATRDRDVIGVATYADLFSNDTSSDDLIKDHCTTHVGLIESTVNFSILESLLSRFNWVVNIHTITEVVHCDSESKSMKKSKDIIGVINTADFMKYKRKIEGHHLKEYKLAMSDGIPSNVWLDKFKEKRLN